MEHQLYPSLSNSNSNLQCCNSSQSYNPNNLCFSLSSPLYCQHNFQPLSQTSPHYCLRQSPPKQFCHKLSSRRCLDAHQRFKNVASPPFQKTTRQLSQDDRDLRTWTFQLLSFHREAAHIRRKYTWDNEDFQILSNRLTKSLEELFRGWPSPLTETNEKRRLKY
jgi:hypothetical protein